MFRIDPLNMTVLSCMEELSLSVKQYFKYKKLCIVAKLFLLHPQILDLSSQIFMLGFFLDNEAANFTQGFPELKLEPRGEFSNAEDESKV